MTQFCVNDELAVCRNELRELADRINLSIFENPSWESVFRVQDQDVANVLYELADKLERNFNDCPCIGTCTEFDECTQRTQTSPILTDESS